MWRQLLLGISTLCLALYAGLLVVEWDGEANFRHYMVLALVVVVGMAGLRDLRLPGYCWSERTEYLWVGLIIVLIATALCIGTYTVMNDRRSLVLIAGVASGMFALLPYYRPQHENAVVEQDNQREPA
ncbi:hypothetical protein HYV72_02055 [Candidatus Uhrbacteria bacterium]|nr:hypothetical protein [Candidatus Uhrbacteria bacterium]